MQEQVDARKTRLGRDEALALARRAADVHVTRGKKQMHLRMQDAPDDDTLAGLLLGPTGNLRAPAMRRGKTLVVGFDEALYRKTLGV